MDGGFKYAIPARLTIMWGLKSDSRAYHVLSGGAGEIVSARAWRYGRGDEPAVLKSGEDILSAFNRKAAAGTRRIWPLVYMQQFAVSGPGPVFCAD